MWSVVRGLVRGAVERRLPLDGSVAVVAVGGATLGGSGKTPIAIACAAELAAAGLRATLVGHAYRAAPGYPRFVRPCDRAAEVGDEAIVAAGALDRAGPGRARVVVAPSRGEAAALAARSADAIVLDGVAQTRPSRASIALLAVDALEPWGRAPLTIDGVRRGAVLRAPIAALAAACDAVVPLVDAGLEAAAVERFAPLGRSVWPAVASSRGAWVGGTLLTWDALGRARVGLVAALARPERLLLALAARGIEPRAVVIARDHGPLGAGARRRLRRATRQVDVWLATPKCAVHAAPVVGDLATLDHTVTLAPELRTRLRALARPPAIAALTGVRPANTF